MHYYYYDKYTYHIYQVGYHVSSLIDYYVNFLILGDEGVNFFNLDPLTGQLTLVQELDFESRTQYILRIRATDGGDLFVSYSPVFQMKLNRRIARFFFDLVIIFLSMVLPSKAYILIFHY